MANIQTKRDIDNRAMESTKSILGCPKISWTLVQNGLQPDRSFISFCSRPSHTLYAALTWRHTANLDETALGSSAAQIWGPKDVKLEMLSRRAALSGNTSQ